MEVLERHGVDAFRYFFLRHIDTFADSDFTWEKFENAYNNELANDLGNLVQRLATLAAKNGIEIKNETNVAFFAEEYAKLMEKYEYQKAFDYVWEKVQGLNRRIDEEKPWMLAKNGETEKLQACLTGLIEGLLNANYMLKPFLPGTAERITAVFDGKVVPPEVPLFPKN